MANKPKLGSESFWEMGVLTMAGGLASCRSCVEHFYFQSHQNANAFLDSCVAGRLLERVSLLDLYGDLGPRIMPTPRQKWYEEPIYISAPIFRSLHLDAARERLENTKRAVSDALHLYYEVLGANDLAIEAAYANAIVESMLRHSDVAEKRKDVDMSPIAKLRLIQDGFRNISRKERPVKSRERTEALVAKRTEEYVNRFFGSAPPELPKSDYGHELDLFIREFLEESHTLAEFWRSSSDDLPAGHKLLWLPVVKELVRYRHHALKRNSGIDCANQFTEAIRQAIIGAQAKTKEQEYSSALQEFEFDLESIASDAQKEAA